MTYNFNSRKKTFQNIFVFSVFLIYNLLSFSSEESKITLVVKKDNDGKAQVLSEYFSPDPNEILVNGENKELDYNNRISVDSDNTIVILSWINGPTDCSLMFYHVESIISIDFSEFDHRGINSMNQMFYHCINLQSVNFYNFDSSSVTDMYGLFSYSQSLSNLDLSNLDVSNVEDMRFMFDESGLEDINLKILEYLLINLYVCNVC